MSRPLISIVVPLFNEEDCFPQLRERLGALAGKLRTRSDVEVLLIDDGSRDRTWEMIVDFANAEPIVRGFSFSRNFGHQPALSFGYAVAKGDAVVTMDGDLQDPPEVVEAMVGEWQDGNDVVYAIRKTREGESWFKLATARWFYRLLHRISHSKAPVDAGDFRLMSRRAVDALNSLRESHRYLRGMVGWVGFKSSKIFYDRDARAAGSTKFSLLKMIRFATDAIVSFSTAPLRLFYALSILTMLPFLGYLIYAFAASVLFGKELVPGWSSLLICSFVFGSINLTCLGIMGEYIGRIYDQVKDRPLYIVAESTDRARTTEQIT